MTKSDDMVIARVGVEMNVKELFIDDRGKVFPMLMRKALIT